MKIETRFNLGDEVFVLYNDRIHCVTVTGVEVFCTLKDNGINYTAGINYTVRFSAGGETRFAESRLFHTKVSLINSL